jgi:hypothetical protein
VFPLRFKPNFPKPCRLNTYFKQTKKLLYNLHTVLSDTEKRFAQNILGFHFVSNHVSICMILRVTVWEFSRSQFATASVRSSATQTFFCCTEPCCTWSCALITVAAARTHLHSYTNLHNTSHFKCFETMGTSECCKTPSSLSRFNQLTGLNNHLFISKCV